MQATVTGVDDAGNAMCVWDCGSSLSLAYGEDRAHKVSTEDEAKGTLDWYGTKQPEQDCRCPRCGEMMWGPKARHALSRWADITVCDRCGMEEALEKAGMVELKPLMKWCAVELPAVGGGGWRGKAGSDAHGASVLLNRNDQLDTCSVGFSLHS